LWFLSIPLVSAAAHQRDGRSCGVSNRECREGSGDALLLAWNFSGDCWRPRRATSTERFTAAVEIHFSAMIEQRNGSSSAGLRARHRAQGRFTRSCANGRSNHRVPGETRNIAEHQERAQRRGVGFSRGSGRVCNENMESEP